MEKKEQSTVKDFDCERQVNLSVQWNRWMLKPMGVWPYSLNASACKKYFGLLINAVCYGLIIFLFLPCAMYSVLEVKDAYDRLKLIGPLNFCVMAIMKYSALILHRDDIRECVDRIKWDWRNITYFKDRDIMITNASFARRLVTVCTCVMYSGFVFYYIGLPIKIGRISDDEANATFLPIMFPFSRRVLDTRYSPVNEIVFSGQILAGALIHGITAGACSLTAAFAVHACGQIKVLSSWLQHLVDGRADMCDDIDVRIGNVVSQHVRVLQFLTLTEKALQHISLVEVLGCMFNMCLLGYYILAEWDRKDIATVFNNITLLISFVFNIFIYCYIGELVDEQCQLVGEITYMIDWHRIPARKKLCIVLILARSSATVKLTAGNIIILSLSTFTDVIKSSVAFFNMLRTLT